MQSSIHDLLCRWVKDSPYASVFEYLTRKKGKTFMPPAFIAHSVDTVPWLPALTMSEDATILAIYDVSLHHCESEVKIRFDLNQIFDAQEQATHEGGVGDARKRIQEQALQTMKQLLSDYERRMVNGFLFFMEREQEFVGKYQNGINHIIPTRHYEPVIYTELAKLVAGLF